MTTATSSSDRYEAARAALTEYRGPDVYTVHSDNPSERYDVLDAAEVLAAALRSLIEPPATEESVGQVTARVAAEIVRMDDLTPAFTGEAAVSTIAWWLDDSTLTVEEWVTRLIESGIHAGIQAARGSF